MNIVKNSLIIFTLRNVKKVRHIIPQPKYVKKRMLGNRKLKLKLKQDFISNHSLIWFRWSWSKVMDQNRMLNGQSMKFQEKSLYSKLKLWISKKTALISLWLIYLNFHSFTEVYPSLISLRLTWEKRKRIKRQTKN